MKPDAHILGGASPHKTLASGFTAYIPVYQIEEVLAAEAANVKFAWASYGYEAEPPQGASDILERFEDILRL